MLFPSYRQYAHSSYFTYQKTYSVKLSLILLSLYYVAIEKKPTLLVINFNIGAPHGKAIDFALATLLFGFYQA